MALAQQAMTTAAATANRFVLGIGLSHKLVIEGMLGLSYAHPARHMREYLAVLRPLLRGEVVNHSGSEYRVANLQVSVPGVSDIPVVVAALGEKMLRLTGQLADGTSTWMVGPRTMETHIVRHLSGAASAAGRPAPRVIGGYPIVLTSDVAAARAKIAETFAVYGQLPSYRAMLDLEGYAGPADAALVGDEATLAPSIAPSIFWPLCSTTPRITAGAFRSLGVSATPRYYAAKPSIRRSAGARDGSAAVVQRRQRRRLPVRPTRRQRATAHRSDRLSCRRTPPRRSPAAACRCGRPRPGGRRCG